MDKYVTPLEECLNNATLDPARSGVQCNRTWDTITCWQPAAAGSIAKQKCPSIFSALPGSMVYKTCQIAGTWSAPDFWKGFGYSDYSECVKHLDVLQDVFKIEKDKLKVEDSLLATTQPPSAVSMVSVVLSSISLICLTLSILMLYCVFPKYLARATQYKLSRNHFLAIMVNLLVILVRDSLYLSDFFYNTSVSTTSIVCESLITVEGYGDMLTYMWLLIQTHHIQMRTRSGTMCTSGYLTYSLVGWGIPAIPTTVWAVTMAVSYKVTCWPEHAKQTIIWVMYASKLIMLIAVSVFLAIAIHSILKNRDRFTKLCCLRRTYFDTVVFSLYFIYAFLTFGVLVTVSQTSASSTPWDYVTAVMTSSRGFVLSVLFWPLNVDLRKYMRKSIGKHSRQELGGADNAVDLQRDVHV